MAAVQEDRALLRVAVQVGEEEELAVALQLPHHLLARVDRRVEHLGRLVPPPVEVGAAQVGALVADDDAVGVEQRHLEGRECTTVRRG